MHGRKRCQFTLLDCWLPASRVRIQTVTKQQQHRPQKARNSHGCFLQPARRFFLELLQQRLSSPDCQAAGWVLDGFPHTQAQAARLAALGFAVDKAVFLEGPHGLLAERIRLVEGSWINVGGSRRGARARDSAGAACSINEAGSAGAQGGRWRQA